MNSRYCEIRSQLDGQNLILEGMPVVFNQKTLIKDVQGDFYEVIAPSAFSNCSLRNVHLFYNHDPNKIPLARSPKTMSLTLTDEGLKMRAALPNTENAKAVYEAVKRGDLSGMSFAFEVADDSYDIKTNTRTINGISKLIECSIVPYPAYPQASVEARSAINDSRKRFQKINEMKIMINQIRRVKI